jgi:replicative DNA helicase Mcm
MAIVTTSGLSSGEQAARWTAFFEEADLRRRVLQIAEAYPAERSLLVDFGDLERSDRLLADAFLARPEEVVRSGEQAIRDLLPASLSLPGPIRLRVEHLPPDQRVPIHQLRKSNIGHAVAIEGIVRRATTPLPQVVDGVFECSACRQRIHCPQERTLPVLRTPAECDPAQNGCGKPSSRARFTFLEAESITVDSQRLEVQEEPEGMRGGSHPENLTVLLSEDLVEQIAPGTRVTVNGVIHPVPRPVPARGAGATSNILDVVLLANSIEMRSQDYMEINITEEDRKEIERWRGDPNVFDRIVRSLAPSIKGMSMEKKAIALQLFGGVEKNLPDGVRIRGDSHVLLIGDPGTAKSQLLMYVARTAPRGVYTSGKGTTSAGLTAAAVRDDFAGGRWVLEAGAMVLADRGFLAIDELDKMSPEDRSSMHEALEAQQVSISKAGINRTLKARCPVLAAANPKFGRFTGDEAPQKQFDLQPTLLSRFDVILPVRDRPNPEADQKLAHALLEQHRAAEERESLRQRTGEASMELGPDVFSQAFMKKYVAYARQHVRPVMDQEAFLALEAYYTRMRASTNPEGEGNEGGGVAITARQLEALVRLTESSARSRLSTQATVKDAERAIEVIDFFLQQLTTTAEGRHDIDLLVSRFSSGQRDVIVRVRSLMRQLQSSLPNGWSETQLLEAAREQKIPEEGVRRALKELLAANEIYQPRQDFYKLA